MNWLRQFARFWYDFVIGDDWTVAATVVVLVGLTFALVELGVNAWPVLAFGVAASLAISVWRDAQHAARKR